MYESMKKFLTFNLAKLCPKLSKCGKKELPIKRMREKR